jgi:subtilisin family serine protease
MSKLTHKFLTSIVLVGLALSCGPKPQKSSESQLKLVNSELFSTRAVNVNTSVFLVRLSEPALMESAQVEPGGQVVVDPNAKKLVVEQQANFIEELKKIDESIEVIYSMKLIMNALTVAAPKGALGKISSLPMVSQASDQPLSFEAPPEVDLEASKAALNSVIKDLQDRNSATFIGADVARERYDLRGQGLKIGVIDTGVDYTHAMFGGAATTEAYEAIDPNAPTPAFPNAKVTGGIDLVGELYSPGSVIKESMVPNPDKNPLDKKGHGTHVAGTIAGFGNGKNTFDGVAPAADIYAIKVFGAGGTSDSVVIAALEYALDPNSDLDLSDKLDVVNLSLGGNFGKPSINYNEAVMNTLRAGVSVVASAGNSGPVAYIVGAPSTATDAFSIGASIDDSSWNWRSNGVAFSLPEGEVTTLAVEGAFTKQLDELEDIDQELVYVGLADQAFSEELKAKLKGKTALIDRGGIGFVQKIKAVEDAGAVAAIVVNNAPGEPIVMGGEGKAGIPGVMISQAIGEQVKDALTLGAVKATLSRQIKVDRVDRIDTLTAFSSWGPRSEDGMIKPEIVAPGEMILSAAAGSGDKGVKQNGTSMSGPHMAGVMLLLRQRYPKLTALEHKAIAMGTAKIISDKKDVRYPVAAQGAGRVDIAGAIEAKVFSTTPALSLGLVNISSTKTVLERVTLNNLSEEDLALTLSAETDEKLTFNQEGMTVSIPAGGKKQVALSFTITASDDQQREDLNGYVFVKDSEGENLMHMPVLAVVKRISDIKAQDFAVMADGPDLSGALVKTSLTNNGKNPGLVLPFNLLAKDKRKPDFSDVSHIRSRACDLESVGYRTIKKMDSTGRENEVLQVAAKVFEPLTDWQSCILSVLIDSDKDGETDQELVAVTSEYLPGINQVLPSDLYTFLLDSEKAQEIRRTFEATAQTGFGALFGMFLEDYRAALQGVSEFKRYNHSTLAILEVETSLLERTEDGDLNVRVAAVYEDSDVPQSDDFLVGADKWHSIKLNAPEQGYLDLPNLVEVAPGQTEELLATKGLGNEELILYMPYNRDTFGSRQQDYQSQVLK